MSTADPMGQALHDYYYQAAPAELWIHNRYGEPEEMPVDIYFRTLADMPEIEWNAMEACRGRVLDIGAGAGSHTLALQEAGVPITALEISAQACQVMRARGVQQVICDDIFSYSGERFGTLLLLMNGIGLCGNLEGLSRFLRHARNLVVPGGQLIFDSSDIAYLYEDDLPEDRYYGEISYRYSYKDTLSPWFNWLYIDRKTLQEVASREGWTTEILFEQEPDGYLARLQ